MNKKEIAYMSILEHLLPTHRLKEFITESSKIEGIETFSMCDQLDAYIEFLSAYDVTTPSILKLAKALSRSCYDTNKSEVFLRDKYSVNVRIGNHFPPKGGPGVAKRLNKLLMQINSHSDNFEKLAFKTHQRYESLHPLTDCNGRTGRAIWAWIMLNSGYRFELGFLHKFYFQCLSFNR